MLYSIDASAGLVRLDYQKAPTFDEWAAVMRAVFQDPAYRPGFAFLSDHRGLEPPTTEYVRSVAEFVTIHREKLTGSRWAVVVGSPAAYGMARMGQTLAEGFGGEAAIFTDADAADAWLREESSQGENPAP